MLLWFIIALIIALIPWLATAQTKPIEKKKFHFSEHDGLQKTLAQYGATFANVVKENLYTTDIEAVKKKNEARKAYYKGDFPAATWLQIDRLYMSEANLEVDLIAIIED